MAVGKGLIFNLSLYCCFLLFPHIKGTIYAAFLGGEGGNSGEYFQWSMQCDKSSPQFKHFLPVAVHSQPDCKEKDWKPC